jgi:plastocyanin
MPSLRSPRIRRHGVAIVLVASMAVVVGLASPAFAKGSKTPVKLSGKVNNEGVGKIASGGTELELDDFYFKQTFLKGTAGTVTLELKNEGSVPHTFTVDAQNIDDTLQPGDSKNVTVQLAATAPTTFYCKFHKSMGMQGAMFVKGGATAAANTGAKNDSKSSGSGGGSGGYDYGP